jgi:DNA replication protein DnaC
MDAIKNTYSNKSGKGKEAIINTYAFVDCLIIDNMEMFNPTKDNVTSLFSLLEKRYNWMKSTIICSRTSAGELHNLVGDGLYQKIKSGGVERVLSEKFILN